MLAPPAAPSKQPTPSAATSGPTQSPTALNLSGIERSVDEGRRSANGNRLERQNATIESPPRNTSTLDESLISAIDRNTSQLVEMFDNLSNHVNEIERRINQAEKKNSEEE